MVGRRHQRETDAPQSPGWGCEEIPDRICGTLSSRRSSANHQQSLRTQEPAANDNQHAWEHYSQEELPLKALSTQDAYIIYAKNWIVPRWGNLPLEQEDCRGRALVASDGTSEWYASEDKVRDVGFVFARRSVAV